MADRLEELRRQRALVQQHLEWLDREIATESAKATSAQPSVKLTAPSISSFPSAASTLPASVAPASAPSANPDADTILEKYRTAPTALHEDVRKGCFLYFAAALALFFAVVAILYFTLSNH